jgi:hypothetical protein
MAEVLNRLGFRRRQVVKATPQKKMAETDAMCANSEKKPGGNGLANHQTLAYRWYSHGGDR